MSRSILINGASIYLASLAIMFIQSANGAGEKSSCHLYGHSCLGAHGKRSNELDELVSPKLIAQDPKKYFYQMLSLENRINNHLNKKLISHIMNNNNLNSDSSSRSPFDLISLPSIITKLGKLDQSSQQLPKRQANRFNLEEILAYPKISNDF